MAKKAKQEELPGVQGPLARAVEEREALDEALKAVQGALIPFIDRLSVDHGTAAQFRISRKIGGDTVTVSFKPGEHEWPLEGQLRAKGKAHGGRATWCLVSHLVQDGKRR